MRKLPDSVYNPISLIGAAIALVMLGSILIFFFMDVMGYTQSPYLGIFTYMLLPGVMFMGLLLIPVGIWLEKRRQRKHKGEARRYMVLDLNQNRHRTAVMVFTVGTMLLVVISAAGTYQAYTYSESVEFCGEVCHVVMAPEYIAYQHSPHARVPCASCHIGEGADWFVKAKISGAYQVYSVLFDKYHRPIATPLENLRPARETCEKCHWPSKFSSDKKLEKVYYPIDTTDAEPWMIQMDLKIGGGQSELGPTEGIHWHMNTANKVSYITTDHKRETIPWIKSTDLNGVTRIFRAVGFDMPESELRKFEERKMDCIDCHNRPSHIYYPPFRTINDAMRAGTIDASLPGIRGIASYAMTREFSSTDEAKRRIPELIRAEYRASNPDILTARKSDIDKSIRQIVNIYSRNFFPEMKVNWKVYPNHIGHMYDLGCFRCHDNKHVSDDGKVLTNDCSLCHTIIKQGPISNPESNIAGMEFRHPTDIEGAWKDVNCSDCHLGN
jgi:nitrate/TMAO reductase-like tetraheme cytochrome c subunit